MSIYSLFTQNRRRPRTRGSRKWFLKPVLLACLTALILASPSLARAVTPFADISSAGPLTHVYIGNDLSCQVAHTGDVALELYPPGVIPGDCGAFLAVGGTLFAPDFANHGGTATLNLGSFTPFTPVSQSAVTGSGTAADPFKVVTVVDAGTSGLRIMETDSYVVGEGSYRTDVAVSNTGTAAQDVVLYRAGDCFLQGSDIGFGFVDTVAKSVGCSVNANNTPPGRIEEWLPITGGNNYYQAAYSEVWGQIGSHVAFPDTCRCTDLIDNGAGISWSFSVPAGGTVTKSHFTVFSPLGISVSIDDVTVTEGNSGTVNATFTVSLNRAVPAGATATVDFTTADGTAISPADYAAAGGTLTFAPGESSKTVTVGVNGDTVCETDETFFVNLSNATGMTIADGQGQGTIVNDDPCVPSLSINDATVVEGNSGVTNAIFTVTLSQATVNTVTVDFTTADGTAIAPADYGTTGGTLTFAPGESSKTVTVGVNGDTLVEPDETFFLDLSNVVGATIADGRGQGTIINDDDVGRPALDHFKCYALRESDEDDDGDDRAAGPRVTLEDQFGSGQARVGAAAELCNPVSKDGGAINQESAHLVKYKARPIGRTFANRRVEVTNQFGTQILTVRKPTILAVPSSKSTSGPPGDPPTMLDHFQCYRLVENDDDGGDFRPRTVVLKDQFKEESVRVRGPVALCTPAAKTHAGQVSPIGSPDEHLVCYAIRAAPFAATVNVRNQFGEPSLRVRRPVSLCVPSQKSEASNHVVIATAPGSHLVDSTTLRGAFSVLNTGDLVADSVEITKIELPGATAVSPALPLSVGAIAGDASVPVSVEFSGGPFSPDQTYPLHVEGTFTINHVRHSFVSDLTLAIPPSAPGSATVDTVSVDANAVDGGHFPHQPLGFEDEVNQPRWTVPSGDAAPGTPTPVKTDVRPAPFGDPPAIQFDRNTSLGLTSGTTNGTAGSIAEPSGASSGGGVVFATANWTAAYSTDGGATFTQLDPTTIFPSDAVGFCCDQVVQYVPSIDRFIWILQGNGYRLASASPSDIINSGGTAWTYWNLTPSIFGALTGTGFDYPDVSVGNNSLYVSWDAGFPCPTNCNWGFQVARISLSAIQASGTISIGFTDPANGRDAWGSHLMQDTGNEAFWAGHEENDIVRVFSLAENSNTYFWRDVDINGWPNNALSSLTPDNQNWLTGSNGFPGNAIIGATRTGSDLWFAWMAGTNRDFKQPHIEMVSVDRGRNFQKTQQVQIWNDNYAFGYPALATNSCTGEVGLSFEFGGGGNYENHVVGFWGDFVAYITTGTNVGTTRFGDYVSIRQAPVTEEAPGNLFDAFGYGLLKVPPPGTGTNTDIHYVRFGRPASSCIG